MKVPGPDPGQIFFNVIHLFMHVILLLGDYSVRISELYLLHMFDVCFISP